MFKHTHIPCVWHATLNLSIGGLDYVTPINIAFTFVSGSAIGSMLCDNIVIIDDTRVEGAETFSVALTSNDPVDITDSPNTIIINDANDSKVASIILYIYIICIYYFMYL